MASDQSRRAKPILIAGAAVFALAVVGIGWVAWPRGSTAISHEDALEDFRRGYEADNLAEGSAADSSDTSTTGASNASERPSIPEPGVYTYAAEGNEQVKLDRSPLRTAHCPEPSRSWCLLREQGSTATGRRLIPRTPHRPSAVSIGLSICLRNTPSWRPGASTTLERYGWPRTPNTSPSVRCRPSRR